VISFLLALFNSLFRPFIIFLSLRFQSIFRGESEIDVLIGIFSVSSLVFRSFVGKTLLRIPERNFMIAGALLFAITSLAFLLVPPFWPFLIVRVFQGIGLAFFIRLCLHWLPISVQRLIGARALVTSFWPLIWLLLWLPILEC
jgi:MFS family permease